MSPILLFSSLWRIFRRLLVRRLERSDLEKTMDLEARIRSLVEEHFQGTDCFLADIKIASGGQRISVFVDQMSKNISIDKCASLSRLIESTVEEEGLVPEKYVLEVSSPGMGNPFKVSQQFQKNIGRNVIVLMRDGSKKEGLLKTYDEQEIELEIHQQKRKNAPPEVTRESIDLNLVKSVKKKITFK